MTAPADPAARAERTARATARATVTADRDRRGRNAWWRRGLRIVRRRTGSFLVWLLLPGTLRLLAATWKIERVGSAHFTAAEAAGGGFLIALWHGDMLAPMPLHARRGTAVLVSPSGDGSLVKTVLQRYGYTVIRGSTNRGSARALRAMQDHLAATGPVVITPDGPRGPRHGMNLGLAWLSRETASSVVCVGVTCDRAWQLQSWDRFQIPKPWARVRIEYVPIAAAAGDADDAALERMTRAIRTALGPASA